MLEVADSSLARSAEVDSPHPSNLRGSQFFKSRLAWRVAFAVWLSIVVVEAVILLTSVNGYRQQLLDQLDRVGIAAVKAALPVHLRGESQDLDLVDEVLARQSAIRGGALYGQGDRLIGRFGEPPRASPQDFAARSAHAIAPSGQDRRETFWAAADTGLPYDVVLRLDSSWLQGEVAAFVRRVMGLTLVISVVAAAITFWTLSRVMLLPLLQLRDTLDAARDDPSRPALYQLPVDRSDELGDVIAVFNAMQQRAAVNLETLRRHREALSGTNQKLEQRVAERTAALTATNQSLEKEIAERRAAEARLEHLATHDPLTGLPNRALFRDRLERALTQTRRQRQMVAILVLDLDGFKEVNDVLGHPAGDALLERVAARLLAVVRETDTVARLGSDEFAIVQVGLAQPSGAHALAMRLVGAIAQGYRLDGQEVDVGVGIGIAVAPVDGEQADPLLIHADAALRRAKADGRGAFRFFEPAMDEELKRRRALERDLRNALVEDQFELLYQPRINLETGIVAGFEALLRWRHPTRGVVTPDEFIGVAEDTGLIDAIGAWVIKHACIEASAWPAPPGVSVNLSPAQFCHGNVVETVTAALEESKLETGRLEVEITESALLRDTEEILATLRELRRLGVRIAMDDFGTGYSSLSYLRRFPFDHIKIDRSFVVGLDDDPGARAIIRAVVSLSRGLGMQITAEGVETDAQLALLRAEGCTEVQGFLFSGPVPAPDVPRVIETKRDDLSKSVASRRCRSGRPRDANAEAARR